ncbi:MAG TPA: DUF2334 domain-containing protein [Pirellulales bacterium]|jgi:hypothetical protein|nr:DUF2334 domain-containing protein [Pirellulales bacterium]
MTVPFGATGSRFCVVVHDVTPFFAEEIERLLKTLQPLIHDRVVGAVVSRWHGTAPNASDRRRLRDWSTQFGDLVLHGWTHRREIRHGIVSWCTDAANEFERLSLGETLERLRRAQLDAEDLLGRPLRGLVPPAWRLAAKITHLFPLGIEYVMRFRSLEAYGKSPVTLATWSWDWGWLPGTRFAGAALGACCQRLNPRAVPTVVLHPLDVRRGCLSAAQRLIRRFLSAGLVPVLPSHLITPVAGDAGT